MKPSDYTARTASFCKGGLPALSGSLACPTSSRDARRKTLTSALRGIDWRIPLAWARRVASDPILLILWDVDCLSVVVALRQGKTWTFSEEASSSNSDFGLALGEALSRIKESGCRVPGKCCLAARFIVPARVDLPVNPDRPRPVLQMREMIRAEIESVVAESGALWTIGAILAARGLIALKDRERIALELAVRREQSSHPVYFGQTAIELGLINKDILQETLNIQEKLQTLEAFLACGWTGYTEEPGTPPVWLASGMGLSVWNQMEAACKRHRLKLCGAMPIAWGVSEPAGIAAETLKGTNRITFEIHPEEIVAVLRRSGRIVASRSEGRMERPFTVKGLLGLVSDWRASGVNTLEIACCARKDEAEIEGLLKELDVQLDEPHLYRDAEAVRQNLYECLARQRGAREMTLPLIRFGDLPKPLWKRAGFWHLACPLFVLLMVFGMHIDQRMKVRTIQSRFEVSDFESRRQSGIKQQEVKALILVQREKEELDAARRKLAKITPEIERLEAIENMASQLPRLLRTLAANISDDVVLESVRNSRSGGNIGEIMIVGWTISYASAQSFALRVQGALSGPGYSVAQTEVSAGVGRGGKNGYFVSFWLLPKVGEELGLEDDLKGETP